GGDRWEVGGEAGGGWEGGKREGGRGGPVRPRVGGPPANGRRSQESRRRPPAGEGDRLLREPARPDSQRHGRTRGGAKQRLTFGAARREGAVPPVHGFRAVRVGSQPGRQRSDDPAR